MRGDVFCYINVIHIYVYMRVALAEMRDGATRLSALYLLSVEVNKKTPSNTRLLPWRDFSISSPIPLGMFI